MQEMRPELIVATVALLLRIVYLWEMRTAPVFRYSYGDGLIYDTWARAIVAGDWLGKGVFYQAPLYPYFLAGIHALFGPGLLPVRVMQVLLGTASCVLLVRAGRLFFSPGVGLAAGLLLAFSSAAIFFDGLIQKSALDLFFVTLLLVILGNIHREDTSVRWLWAGLVLGGLLLTRENALVILFVALVWLGIRHRANPRAGSTRAALLLAGWAVVVLPIAMRNLAVGGEFHLTTAGFGGALYAGNNPAADGMSMAFRPGAGDPSWERAEITAMAEQALGRSLTAGEVSRYWADRAMSFIAGNPGRWLVLMARKWLMFWNRQEILDTDDQQSYGDWSLVLRLLNRVSQFGLLFPLAATGVFMTLQRWRELWVLYAMTVLYAGSVVLFVVSSRYRHPVVPILALFAGAGVVFVASEISRRSWRQLVAPAGITLLVAAVAYLPVVPERPGNARALMQNNLGGAVWNTSRDAEEAMTYFQESIRISPEYAEPYKNIGLVLRMTGRWNEAMLWYFKAVALTSRDPYVFEGLGICATNLGLTTQAADWFRRALALNPKLADANYGMGLNLEKTGRSEEARRYFAEAVRLDPTYPRPLR